MRNHPAEWARQIQAVERAGHDPALGTWPGDPGGPTGEARLTPELCPLCSAGVSDCATDGCGIDLASLGERFTAERLREEYEMRAKELEAMADDLENRELFIREKVDDLYERALIAREVPR